MWRARKSLGNSWDRRPSALPPDHRHQGEQHRDTTASNPADENQREILVPNRERMERWGAICDRPIPEDGRVASVASKPRLKRYARNGVCVDRAEIDRVFRKVTVRLNAESSACVLHRKRQRGPKRDCLCYSCPEPREIRGDRDRDRHDSPRKSVPDSKNCREYPINRPASNVPNTIRVRGQGQDIRLGHHRVLTRYAWIGP